MFPTFEAPQHAETVGMRKARKARERTQASRRLSTSTSNSSENRTQSDAASIASNAPRPAPASLRFGFWKRKDKDVTEILDAPMELGKGAASKTKPPPLSKTSAVIETAEISEPSPTDSSPPLASPTSIPSPRLPTSASSTTSGPSLAATSHSSLASTDAYSHSLQPPPLPHALWRHHAPATPPPSRGLPALPNGPPIPRSYPSLSKMPSRINSTYSATSGGTMSVRSGHSASAASVFTAPPLPTDDTVSELSDYEQSTTQSQKVFSLPHRSAHSPLSSPLETSHPRSHVMKLRPEAAGLRPGSRMAYDHSDAPPRTPTLAPFARALAKMENAGPRIIAARLGEEWDGLQDNESYQEIMFEKRLWALTAYQWLTQGKQMQSPTHELLLNSPPEEGRRILHLHGSLADGWTLAARYPTSTVYSLTSTATATHPTTYPAPLNHHSLYVPSTASPLPFPDNYFDAVLSRALTTTLDNNEWASVFHDCKRVLRPGARMEILSLDPYLTRQGPKLKTWADAHIVSRLETQGKSMMPSDTVIDTMGIVGLQSVKRARIALPAHSPNTPDQSRLITYFGRHVYSELYGEFLGSDQGEQWFWNEDGVLQECERMGTKMVLTIACAMKPVQGRGAFHFET